MQMKPVDETDDPEQMCISAIIPGGNSTTIILGDNFLRAFYTAYMHDPKTGAARVGIAKTSPSVWS